MMRALGYTDADVGINWPLNYLNAAASVGLTSGFSQKPTDPVSRGAAALLIERALFCFVNNTQETLLSRMGVTEKDAYIADVNALMPDGKTRAVLTAAGERYPFITGIRPLTAGTLTLTRGGETLAFAQKTFDDLAALGVSEKDVYIADINALMPDGKTRAILTAAGERYP
jgi:hypothetical protein